MNNNTHYSVGGQSTYANDVDFEKLSKSLGFKKFYLIKNKNDLVKNIKKFLSDNNLSFLEVKVENNKIKKLPRTKDIIEIKNTYLNKWLIPKKI